MTDHDQHTPADIASQIERILRIVAAHDEPDWGRTAAEIARLTAGSTPADQYDATVHQLLRSIDARCGAHTERLAAIEWKLIQLGVLPSAEETTP